MGGELENATAAPPEKMNPNWFDLLVVVTILVGVMRGRKRGMSEELIDLLQWICIVVGGAFLYQNLGELFANTMNTGLLIGNILAYTLLAVLLKLLFSALKRSVGEKLVGSDTFGRFEYYLGMTAGAIRFACILLFAINFLHARYISDAQRAATARLQRDNFGSISFPTIGSLQHGVFYESMTGPFLRKHLKALLIRPAAPGGGGGGDNIYKRRQRDVEEVIK